QARAGEAEHLVAGARATAVDDGLALDDADTEAGHVEVAGLVEVRQDRRLAADERTIGVHAAVADALDELPRQFGVVLRHGEVVEEHQRFAAGAEAVVDGHGDEVDADRVVLVAQHRNLELAADAVGAGDDDGVLVVASEEAVVEVEADQAGEAAEAV